MSERSYMEHEPIKAQPITCVRCGYGKGTLMRVRDIQGKKVKPAQYLHSPACPYHPPVQVLTKAEILAESSLHAKVIVGKEE